MKQWSKTGISKILMPSPEGFPHMFRECLVKGQPLIANKSHPTACASFIENVQRKRDKKQTSHLFTWIIPQVGFRTDKLISSPSTSFQHLPTMCQHQKCRQQELWHQPKLHALLFGAIPLIYHRFASSLIPPHNWVALNDPCFSSQGTCAISRPRCHPGLHVRRPTPRVFLGRHGSQKPKGFPWVCWGTPRVWYIRSYIFWLVFDGYLKMYTGQDTKKKRWFFGGRDLFRKKKSKNIFLDTVCVYWYSHLPSWFRYHLTPSKKRSCQAQSCP